MYIKKQKNQTFFMSLSSKTGHTPSLLLIHIQSKITFTLKNLIVWAIINFLDKADFPWSHLSGRCKIILVLLFVLKIEEEKEEEEICSKHLFFPKCDLYMRFCKLSHPTKSQKVWIYHIYSHIPETISYL